MDVPTVVVVFSMFLLVVAIMETLKKKSQMGEFAKRKFLEVMRQWDSVWEPETSNLEDAGDAGVCPFCNDDGYVFIGEFDNIEKKTCVCQLINNEE